jgi:protein-tyrosine-phosphatase
VKPVKVLFLCTGNSARSLIAEALLTEFGGADFEVHSAGTHPKGVNPYTERVLTEQNLSTAGLRSKSLDLFMGLQFDYVITVCDAAAEECPIFPGAPDRIHWSFVDPAAAEGADLDKLAVFRETLRGMRRRVQAFIPVALKATTRSTR